MKVETPSKRDKVKVNENTTKLILELIHDLCINNAKLDVSKQIKELKEQEKSLDNKLNKNERLLEQSNKIEDMIKKDFDNLIKENEMKRLKLLILLGANESDEMY